MELSEIIPHIEALIFASDRPLTSLDLVDLINNAFGFMEQQITLDQVETALEGIREKYNADFYPFEVFQSGGGWQFLSKPAFHTTIAQLNGGKFLKKLSNAALETLSIIAYKQPITKGEIESIRGVNSDYSVQKLLEKELIVISGRNEELPGKPLIYETSKSFMDYFGLNSASDLPKIKEVLAEQIEPTMQQRTTEENADFGIFGKFDGDKRGAENLEVQAEGTSGREVHTTTEDLPIDPEDAGELELSDEESRESIHEAAEQMDQQLHPDLSSIGEVSETNPDEEWSEPQGDNLNDLQDEELADLEETDELEQEDNEWDDEDQPEDEEEADEEENEEDEDQPEDEGEADEEDYEEDEEDVEDDEDDDENENEEDDEEDDERGLGDMNSRQSSH